MSKLNKIEELRSKLLETEPIHDTPVGLLHPYWARKPLNLITLIIESLTEKGDLVADPFMGSGTTIFAALSAGRNALGSDLNPLAVFIVTNTIQLSIDPKKKLDAITAFHKELSEEILPWFVWDIHSKAFIERERFRVEGSFEGGAFELIPTEIITKKLIKNKWSGRSAVTDLEGYKQIDKDNENLHYPVNFSAIKLRPNSRIAIPRGALLSHFFSDRNKAAINLALRKINTINDNRLDKGILQLFLSSSFPLLRLSDKKASSQWPYWRPKESLTSRNPIFMLSSRLEAFTNAAQWLNVHMPLVKLVKPKEIFKQSRDLTVSVFESSARELGLHSAANKKVDLVIIDPPYADQAPYLEYSDLWLQLLALGLNTRSLSEEIVKTDAPDRTLDSNSYSIRLEQAINASFLLLKDSGHLVLFYQDNNLQHWAHIHKAADEMGFKCLDVIPLKKQRRSLKTVTSPGRTLDGDLVLVFGKNTSFINKRITNFDVIKTCRKIKDALPKNVGLFEVYSHIIKSSFIEGWISEYLSKPYDVRKIIKII